MSEVDFDKVKSAFFAKSEISVKTQTRDFAGHIYELGISPYHGDFTARVVDSEGRVHYFRPQRNDCSVTVNG